MINYRAPFNRETSPFLYTGRPNERHRNGLTSKSRQSTDHGVPLRSAREAEVGKPSLQRQKEATSCSCEIQRQDAETKSSNELQRHVAAKCCKARCCDKPSFMLYIKP